MNIIDYLIEDGIKFVLDEHSLDVGSLDLLPEKVGEVTVVDIVSE